MKKFLCAILCYNNKITIKDVIREKRKLKNICDVIFINDGSIDGTKKILKSYKLNAINHKKNFGYGQAVKSAFKYANNKKYDYLAIFPADNQRYVADLVKMIKSIKSSNFDLIVGSKYQMLKKIPFHRKIGNIFFSNMAYAFWNSKLNDVLSGFKVYKINSFYKYLPSLPNDYSFDIVFSQLLSFNDSISKEIKVRCRYNKNTSSMKGIFILHKKNIIFIGFKMIIDVLIFYLRFRLFAKIN